MRKWCKRFLLFYQNHAKTSCAFKQFSRHTFFALLVIFVIFAIAGFDLKVKVGLSTESIIALFAVFFGILFPLLAYRDRKTKATINLLRFFTDDIAQSLPKNYPTYKGVTTRDFALIRVLYDAKEIAHKIKGLEIENFLNRLDVFSSWFWMYEAYNLVEVDHLGATINMFIEYVNDFFDVLCLYRYASSPRLYQNIVNLYSRLEDQVVYDSLVHSWSIMDTTDFLRSFIYYDVYYDENMGIPLDWNEKIYIPIIARDKTTTGISGWMFGISCDAEDCKVTAEGYIAQYASSKSIIPLFVEYSDSIEIKSDPLTPVITNSSGTIFLCYEFSIIPAVNSKHFISINTFVDRECYRGELEVTIEVRGDNGIMHIEKAPEEHMFRFKNPKDDYPLYQVREPVPVPTERRG